MKLEERVKNLEEVVAEFYAEMYIKTTHSEASLANYQESKRKA
jgi:hypothetical protein